MAKQRYSDVYSNERQIQEMFVRYVNSIALTNEKLYLAFAIPNGGKRDLLTAVLMKRSGVRAGVWDFHIPYPSADGKHGKAWIEFKHVRNKLTEQQIAFKDRLSAVSPSDDWKVFYDAKEAFQYFCEYSGVECDI